jgi:beta-galactosidase
MQPPLRNTEAHREPPRVRLDPRGLDLGGGEILPLYSGAMHYFRHPPADWGRGLDAICSMGLRLVDVYVPWAVHELEAGRFDFGSHNPSLDVARFLEMAHARGLKVVLRPGPHINAELTRFGLPERVVWDKACQALTPRGNPVMLPVPPLAFPVPSYASDAFHDETARWFDALGKELSRLRHPEGPIVLCQVDNEGALYFRDGPYDQDYHPDALRLFRGFLRDKYGSADSLSAAWEEPGVTFARAPAPERLDAKTVGDLARHLDWVEFHEHLLAYAMDRFARTLRRAGLGGVPTMHNLPMGEAATPLNAARIGSAIDLLSLDYYHRATPTEHLTVFRRTTELVSRCEGTRTPPFGAEVGAGYPPFFAPITPGDSLYTLLIALAYGLRGANLYMAVERDRWIGAPIDVHGRRRPLALEYDAIFGALTHVRWHELRRRAPVRLVIPRSLRRLARVTHAFGPITPALFNVLGAGFRESVLEDDGLFGLSPAVEGEAYLRAFERALFARGVPFSYAGGESIGESLANASWVVAVLAGGVKPQVIAQLRAACDAGVRVTVGPVVPDRDGSMRLLSAPLPMGALELEPLVNASRADSLVASRIEELALPTYPLDHTEAYFAVHEDEAGTPRVAFVMNPTPVDLTVRVGLEQAGALVDLLPHRHGPHVARETRFTKVAGSFEVTAPARTVRMLAVEHTL